MIPDWMEEELWSLLEAGVPMNRKPTPKTEIERWLKRLRHIAPHFQWQLGTRGDGSTAVRAIYGPLVLCPITATCHPPLSCRNIDQAAMAQGISKPSASKIVLASDGFHNNYDPELREQILKAVRL